MKQKLTNRLVKLSAIVITIVLCTFVQTAKAESKTNPPGTYYTSWLGNTYMDQNNEHANVTELLIDVALSPNGHLFTAGYAETGGGGAEYNASDGSFIARYSGQNSGFGDPVNCVAADNNYVYYGTGSVGILRAPHGGACCGNYTTFLSGGNISGLFIKGSEMYVSDYGNQKIRVLDLNNNLSEKRSWDCEKPTKITVDNSGNVWVVIWSSASVQPEDGGPMWFGFKVKSFSSTGSAGVEITDFDKPTAVGISASGQLMVGGFGSNCNVWLYDLNGTSSATHNGSFGADGGIFSGTAGQFTNSPKLHWIKSIIVDGSGNIITGCAYGSFWGNGVEKWSSSGSLQWRLFAGTSLDCAGIDPNNENEVYSKFHHYSLDYSKTTPGTEWSLKGFTLNRFKYPNDYRVDQNTDVGERSLGAGAFRIGGKLFMARSSQNGYRCEFYRQETSTDGEVLVPSVFMASGSDANNRFYNPTTKSWIDKPKKDGIYTYGSWTVAQNGTLVCVAADNQLIQYNYGGLDAYSNPIWDASNAVVMPNPEFSAVCRMSYNSDEDVMYMGGDFPNGDQYGSFLHVKKFANWSTGNRTSSWTVTVPFNDQEYTQDLQYGGGMATSFTTAGDYIFILYGYGDIRILRKSDGGLVGTLQQNINGYVGAAGQVDAHFGLTAYKRSNNEYVLLFENAGWGNIMMTRWCPTGTCPNGNVPVTGVTVSPTAASVNAGATTSLLATVAPSNATNKAVTWSSSNPAVATVSSSGLVTGVTVGTVTITVKTTDGNKTATSAITVTATGVSGDGLKGDYFNNMTLSGTAAVSRTDATVDFDWGSGSYATGQPVDGFSTRWTGQVVPKYTETYTFETESDDGARLWVNGQQLVNAWVDQGPTKVSGTIALTAGQKYDIKYEYYENGGGATARLRWSSASQAYQIIPQAQLFTTTTPPIAVTGVTVAPPSASINVGALQQLTATVAPSNATNKAVTWSSSNTGVATVSSSGLVTGVTAGTATITVKTTDGNKTATSAITVNTVTGCTASGTILYQRWDGISGTAVSNLTSNANYPNTPTSSSSLTSMEAATDVADNYGARIAGYICAPATGAYTFWIASDDASQLWLSTDGTAANKVKIAEVTTWTNSREWGKQTSQKSATVNLTQGQTYYVEAIMKEGTGGDNLAVGWLKPGQTGTVPSEVVPGSVLSPLVVGTTVPVTGVSVSPTAPSIIAGNTQQLTATVAPSTATNKTVSWSSSNTAVATVSSSGLVTGVTVGTVTITVTTADGGKTATSAVTVTAPTISCIDEQGTVTCYKAASTITVDGNLNEASWCISNTMTKTIYGTKNNTATFGVLYDNTNLYIGVKVLDANIFATNSTDIWENDGIEIYFDPNNSGGTSYDANDRQYIKTAGSQALWANTGGTTGASVQVSTISGGYTMEIKIPFSLLSISSTPANNTLLGFDIGNDDDDNGSGRSSQLSWNDVTGNGYLNPSLFGKLKISSTIKDEGAIGSVPMTTSAISVYPNPSDGTSLTLQGLSGKSVVNIYSLTGSLVYNTIVYASGDVKLEGLNLKPGLYILSASSDNNNANTLKLIVQ